MDCCDYLEAGQGIYHSMLERPIFITFGLDLGLPKFSSGRLFGKYAGTTCVMFFAMLSAKLDHARHVFELALRIDCRLNLRHLH